MAIMISLLNVRRLYRGWDNSNHRTPIHRRASENARVSAAAILLCFIR